LTDPLIVLRKLSLLREHAARVRRRRPSSIEAFQNDVEVQDALSMSLLVSVQESADVAFHIVADEGWGVPASYAEGFELLAQHGVLPLELARAMSSVTALRNRLAHGYASVDAARLWAELPAGLEALDRFASHIADWLDRTS
jgi:uncharacterized protein YutE (UPF0331/DUF86 family)